MSSASKSGFGFAEGDVVRIKRVLNPDVNNRATLVGMTGTVTGVVKSRGVVKIALNEPHVSSSGHTSNTWEALPENIEKVT